MGVDYTGNYGIGVRILTPDLDEDEQYQGDTISWIDDILASTDYSYFEVGSANYSGEENDIYVTIDNPFENGYCGLEEKANNLIQFLQDKGIEFEGTVDVVGGLEIW
jgi:hypothetical protein